MYNAFWDWCHDRNLDKLADFAYPTSCLCETGSVLAERVGQGEVGVNHRMTASTWLWLLLAIEAWFGTESTISVTFVTSWVRTCEVYKTVALKIVLCFLCLFVCASTLIMCTIISWHSLLPCTMRLVTTLSTGVATMSSLAQLWVRGAETVLDVRLTSREQKCQKWAATHDAHRAANQLRIAARRALEWIRTFQGLSIFRYERVF